MAKRKNIPLGNSFGNACRDYRYLIAAKYPQKAVLKLIGDRYLLSSAERSVLYRGIFTETESAQRRRKQAGPESIPGALLAIDGYNVLFTIGSYLNGDFIFRSTDGWVRDASEIHGRKFRSMLLHKAILLLFECLREWNPGEVAVYLDEPVSQSGSLSIIINELMQHHGFSGTASTHKSPDALLKTLQQGLTATSDTIVINHSLSPVVDLPALVLERHFSPQLTDLNAFL